MHKDLYETTKDAVQSGITDAVNSFQFPASTTAFLDAFFGGLKNGDDPGEALESGLKSAVEAAADVIPRMTDKTKSEVSGMLEGAATSAITASVESGIIEESVAGKIIEGIAPAVEEAVGEIQGIEIPKNFFDTTNISDEFWDVVMSAVMELQDELQDDSNYEGIEDTVDNIGENLKFVLENWEDISEHPEKFSDDIQTIYNICKDLLSNNTENLETIKKDNEQLSDAHTWLVFIDDLVQGIANNAKNIDFDFSKGGKGTEEAADGAEEAGEAINALGEAMGGIPSEVSTEFPNNAPAATEETNSLTASINAVPTSKTITFTIVTKGGIPALTEASGTDYFPGGTAFVNDEPGGYNPELIVEKDKAYIVNGGNPALVHISRGAKIFNADETRRILDGGDKLAAFPRFRVGTTTLEKEENKSGGGGKKSRDRDSGSSSDDKDKNEWFDLLKEYMEELYEDAEEALDEQKEAINAQILALKYQTEAAEKANDLEEKRLEMVKAESDLLDAQHERTVRYFNAETNQWEWMADQQAVLDAQEALADAQKDYLDAQYDYLEDLWKKIEDEISDYLEEKNDLNIEDILNQLSGSAAGSELASVTELIQAIKDFTASPTAGLGLKDIASVYDSGGIASGMGFMPKGNSGDEIVLDSILAGRILSPKHSGELTAFTENLASLLDMSSASANPQSLLNRLSNVTNNNGNNTIINGVSIGSDYMDRPLSDVLSVLGIYANS